MMETTATQSSIGTQQSSEMSVDGPRGGRGGINPRSMASGHSTHASGRGGCLRWGISGSGMTIMAVVAALVLIVAAIVVGIRSRAHTETELGDTTKVAAVPTVQVTQPSGGAAAQEITLPGNTQAFTDTPIYARTSGYLRRWYVDIGAHVRKGQLLAEIETPELDQQLLQAQAEALSSKANMELAQTTSTRWQSLLAKHAVSQQETDQVVSDYAAKQAAYTHRARRMLRRLQGVAGV